MHEMPSTERDDGRRTLRDEERTGRHQREMQRVRDGDGPNPRIKKKIGGAPTSVPRMKTPEEETPQETTGVGTPPTPPTEVSIVTVLQRLEWWLEAISNNLASIHQRLDNLTPTNIQNPGEPTPPQNACKTCGHPLSDHEPVKQRGCFHPGCECNGWTLNNKEPWYKR